MKFKGFMWGARPHKNDDQPIIPERVVTDREEVLDELEKLTMLIADCTFWNVMTCPGYLDPSVQRRAKAYKEMGDAIKRIRGILEGR